MNQLQVFNFENQELRTEHFRNEAWFCLKDVSHILEIKNHRDLKRKLKGDGVVSIDIIDSLGRPQPMNFINENNLYRVIFQSRKKEAEKFQDWVYEEVLPAIRETGTYERPKDPMEIMELQFKALKNTNEKVEKIEGKVVYLENEVKIEAGDYGHLGKRIGQKVQAAIRNYNLLDHNDVRKELYKDINSSINRITGVRTRSQLRQKHFDMVLDFINEWEPSSATRFKVKQIAERVEANA